MENKSWTPLLQLLLPVLVAATPARADSFQDQISHGFPGYVIMGLSEFNSDVRDNLESNPAFITGYFNPDGFEDFVALIRDTVAKRYITKERSYDYHETRLLACHGAAGKKYTCTVLFTDVTTPPEYRYLVKRPPGRTKCRSQDGDYLQSATDFIGWASTKSWATGVGETQFVCRPDGSYRRCGDMN